MILRRLIERILCSTLDTIRSTFSLSPSDSASVAESATPTLINQPVVRPDEYPQEVLWNLQDMRSCPHFKITSHNKSRSPVHRCLRTLTGSIISESQWIDIRHHATAIVREILHPLAKHSSDNSTFRKNYFRENWPRKWEDAIAKIEARHPILRLCSFHWKADLVLKHILVSSPGKITTTPPPPPLSLPPPETAPTPSSSLSENPCADPIILNIKYSSAFRKHVRRKEGTLVCRLFFQCMSSPININRTQYARYIGHCGLPCINGCRCGLNILKICHNAL